MWACCSAAISAGEEIAPWAVWTSFYRNFHPTHPVRLPRAVLWFGYKALCPELCETLHSHFHQSPAANRASHTPCRSVLLWKMPALHLVIVQCQIIDYSVVQVRMFDCVSPGPPFLPDVCSSIWRAPGWALGFVWTSRVCPEFPQTGMNNKHVAKLTAGQIVFNIESLLCI